MLTADRQRKIMDYLQVHNSARLTDLAAQLGAGLSTVRRDLQELEDKGLLERVHGGAVLRMAPALDGRSTEPPTLLRAGQQAGSKQRIGETAASLVHDDSTIIITGGTTTAAMLPYLANKRNLTVITNAINIAYTLTRYPQIAVVVLGGWLRHSEMSLLGHLTVQALRELRADQIFHGTFRFDAHDGLAGSMIQEVQTDRDMISAARQLIVLADCTKFGAGGPVRLAPLDWISTVVTDTDTPETIVQTLRAQGIQVIQA